MNTSTVRLISPSSSPRLLPGTSCARSFFAKASITVFSRAIGRARPKMPIQKASIRLSTRPTAEAAITVTIVSLVSCFSFAAEAVA